MLNCPSKYYVIIVVLLYLKLARNGEKTNGKDISKEEVGEDIEDIEDVAGSAEGTGAPVVNSETIEEKIKNSETEIITKFAEVMKGIKSKIDTKLAAETENVIKVQEVLYKMSNRIGAALHDQKDSTASVLKKLIDSLRTEGASVSSLASEVLSQSPSPLKQGEKELEVPSEDKVEADDQVALSEGIEEKAPESAGGGYV